VSRVCVLPWRHPSSWGDVVSMRDVSGEFGEEDVMCNDWCCEGMMM